VVQLAGGTLERARRAAKRHKYETEKDKNVVTIGLLKKRTPVADRMNVSPTIERILRFVSSHRVTQCSRCYKSNLHATIYCLYLLPTTVMSVYYEEANIM
jgi:hypothetical protein